MLVRYASNEVEGAGGSVASGANPVQDVEAAPKAAVAPGVAADAVPVQDGEAGAKSAGAKAASAGGKGAKKGGKTEK